MAKTASTSTSRTLSDAERHCCRHMDHVVVRGFTGGSLKALIVGGDASGIVLRDDIASVEDAKTLFADYDLRLEVS